VPSNPLAEAQAQLFSNKVLEVLATRVLTGTYTPEQQEAALQVLEDAQTSLAACQAGAGVFAWHSKLCSVTVLRTALTQLTALQTPADASAVVA
jgi:citrate lyase beta subunit